MFKFICTLVVLSTERYQIIYYFFLAEQINLMPFDYVQNLYQKSQRGTRLDKRIRGYDTGEDGGGSNTLLLGNDKSNVIALNYFYFLSSKFEVYIACFGTK